MQADSVSCQNAAVLFSNLAARSIRLNTVSLKERNQRIKKEIKDIANYLKKSACLIEETEKKSSLFKPGKLSFSTYSNLNLISQILKKSRYSYASLSAEYAALEAYKGFTAKYFHIGANAKILSGAVKGSVAARIWKKKKFDPRVVLRAEATASLLTASTSARLGNQHVYATARSEGSVGTAYANCKTVLSKKEQTFEAGVGVAALRGETRCCLNVFGVKVILTAEGSIGSAEANFSYSHKSREWEIGSKLGFIAGLGFKVKVSY